MNPIERRRQHQAAALIFSLVGAGCFAYLSSTCVKYPLFDWAVNDLEWTRGWLYMTCVDYEGAALCLVTQPLPCPTPQITLRCHHANSVGSYCVLLGAELCCGCFVGRGLLPAGLARVLHVRGLSSALQGRHSLRGREARSQVSRAQICTSSTAINNSARVSDAARRVSH